MLKFIGLGLFGAFVAFAVFVRIAPADKEVWNDVAQATRSSGDLTLPDGFVTELDPAPYGGETAVFARLDDIILQTQRTKVFSGSLEDQTITYVTRSRVMGFPDYTTVSIQQSDPSRVVIFGRLRFGLYDLGVNKTRIEGWLAQLDGTVPEDTPTQ